MMKNDMGVHSMIDFMLGVKEQFSGFEKISLNVVTQGKQLRINGKYNQFSITVKDSRALHPNDEEMYE